MPLPNHPYDDKIKLEGLLHRETLKYVLADDFMSYEEIFGLANKGGMLVDKPCSAVSDTSTGLSFINSLGAHSNKLANVSTKLASVSTSVSYMNPAASAVGFISDLVTIQETDKVLRALERMVYLGRDEIIAEEIINSLLSSASSKKSRAEVSAANNAVGTVYGGVALGLGALGLMANPIGAIIGGVLGLISAVLITKRLNDSRKHNKHKKKILSDLRNPKEAWEKNATTVKPILIEKLKLLKEECEADKEHQRRAHRGKIKHQVEYWDKQVNKKKKEIRDITIKINELEEFNYQSYYQSLEKTALSYSGKLSLSGIVFMSYSHQAERKRLSYQLVEGLIGKSNKDDKVIRDKMSRFVKTESHKTRYEILNGFARVNSDLFFKSEDNILNFRESVIKHRKISNLY